MGRKPVIKPAILIALSEAENPLRPSEVREKILQILNRKTLDDKQLYYNLNQLIENGVVEKILFNGKVAYKLTTSYYKQQLKSTLIKLLGETKVSHLVDSLDDDELPPYIVFLNPPAYDYEKKTPIEQLDRHDIAFSFGGGPMKYAGESRITPSWNEPSGAISSIMLNDFNGLISDIEKKNTLEMIRWAYWIGFRKTIEDDSYFNISKSIKENKKFALKCIEEFKNNHKRVEAETSLIKILEITEELVNKKNLSELIYYINDNKDEYNHLLNKIMITEGGMAGGERLFLKFLEFGRMVSYGLVVAGILQGDSFEHRLDYREHLLLSSSKVWDDFFHQLIQGPVYLTDYYANELKEIKGNLNESLDKIIQFKIYINNILELPFRRKIFITYLWGYPELSYLANKGIIRTFSEWKEALIKGRLNHRIWLFEDKTLERLRRAYYAVRRNKEPLTIRIDKEPWNFRDLYNYHPFGKDPTFWEGIIRDIEICKLKREEEWQPKLVRDGIYQAFIKKEKEFLSNIFNEEEKMAEKMRKKR